MTKIPNPGEVAAQRKAAAEHEQERAVERARVKTVRQRRRLRNGSRLTSHVSDETAIALAKMVHPDVEGAPRE
ncbi:hypothetical protein [Leucobacter salsicius]|uniref:hypothetical protein n=1 Tax=Leucobacter salsicius TaxID=664638 RepID=UPI00034C5022|nr:hypothetical protein [Leucobacter salsicius]